MELVLEIHLSMADLMALLMVSHLEKNLALDWEQEKVDVMDVQMVV
jgi:hypothetical protein